jgi:hypothetical protein
MGKALGGFLATLASIAAILGLLVVLGIVHPFPSPPILIVSPSSIKAETDCHHRSGDTAPSPIVHAIYDCQVALSASGQGGLNWAVSGGVQGTQFSPQQGTVEPGQSMSVFISVTTILFPVPGGIAGTCPTTTHLIFTNETNPSDTETVTWSC